ncbi:hypothetical protein J2X11_000848 [Aeromicrobium panaciterrae]|uniref:Uncharacterized protein n=1 Tax=Aeromicrobium panaciterrae TaxID=363861 RepID=A0ABU1ULF3_9ACTN|nr:hypothetical protein [Aeromicrobium panaciterrae]MDR7086009.1 hypothetical protein [Aeromicrobium panaciterrae]
MALGFLSGVSNALVSKIAIGAVVVAGVGGAVAKFVPPPSEDVAIWFDQPITKQHVPKGPFNLLLHVGRGEFATSVRVEVAKVGGGAGPTLTTDKITRSGLASETEGPYEPQGLQTATVVWIPRAPGAYKLTPSFATGGSWIKGHTIIVTVDGEPKGPSLPTKPTPTPSPTESTPTPIETTEPVLSPPDAVGEVARIAGAGYVYRFQATAIEPADATVTVNIMQGDESDYSPYPCEPLSQDDDDPSRSQCHLDWLSAGTTSRTVKVSYFFYIEANGQAFTTPIGSFIAGTSKD